MSAEIEVWNSAGYLNLRDHQMLLFILHKQSMAGENGVASGTIVIQMHTLHDITGHVFTHTPICIKATTLVSTVASEQQLELSAHNFKAKLLVEMKTRGEPMTVRASPSEGYEPGTPSAPVFSPAVAEQALHDPAVPGPAVPGPAVPSPAVPSAEDPSAAVPSPAVPSPADPESERPLQPLDWELLQYHLRTVCHVIVEFLILIMRTSYDLVCFFLQQDPAGDSGCRDHRPHTAVYVVGQSHDTSFHLSCVY